MNENKKSDQSEHPFVRAQRELDEYFQSLGFTVKDLGPSRTGKLQATFVPMPRSRTNSLNELPAGSPDVKSLEQPLPKPKIKGVTHEGE